MLKRILATVLCLAILVPLVSLPAFAQVEEPDTLEILQVEVYRNTIEIGDQLYLIRYNIDYTANPDEKVSDTFWFRLMNGATELATVTAVPYFEDGYAEGIVTIYFNATDAPAWNGAYTVELTGNPTLQWMSTETFSAMASAQAYDATAVTFRDETTESNSTVVDDMELLPAAPASGDAYYFGGDSLYNSLRVNIGQQGNYNAQHSWTYWNGTNWDDLTITLDEVLGFEAVVGWRFLQFTLPVDWQKTIVNSVNAYYVRFRIFSFVATTTQPLGTRSVTNALSDPPVVETSDVSLWFDERTVAATTARLTTRIRGLAQLLENSWGGTTDLVEEVGGITVLTETGQDYFEDSISGLRKMAPAVFPDVITPAIFQEKLGGGSFLTGGDDDFYDIWDTTWYGQTITPDQTETHNGVWLKIFRVGTPVDITVSVRATAGGVAAGPDLAVGTLNLTTTPVTTTEAGGWYQITYTEDVVLTGGTEYAITVRVVLGLAISNAGWRVATGLQAGTVGGYIVLARAGVDGFYYVASAATPGAFWYVGPLQGIAGGYAGGHAIESLDSGVTWTIIMVGGQSQDFMFQTTLREGMVYGLRNRLSMRLVGTIFDATQLGANFGLSRMWASAIIWLLFVCLLPAIYFIRKANSNTPALLYILFMLPVGALTGFIYLEVPIIAATLMFAAFAWSFFGRRA